LEKPVAPPPAKSYYLPEAVLNFVSGFSLLELAKGFEPLTL
jgi:hypothetical protein